MSQNKIFYISLILVTTIITGCGGVTPIVSTGIPTTLSTTPVATQVLYPTVIPDNVTSTQTLPDGQYGVVKLSLEIIRAGKTYEVLLGYDIGNAWWNQDAQIPDLPQAYDENPSVSDVNTQWIGDIDKDDNLEYIVELLFCGAYCSSQVQIIDYDTLKDEYRVFDSFGGYYIKDYQDDDRDGNPEIISQDYDYHFNVGGAGATRALAPIQIYRYDGDQGRFIVVTDQLSDLVTEDGDSFLTSIKNNYQEGVSDLMLAGYLYDMYILGKQDEGLNTFIEICVEYVQPQVTNPDWSCDNYLSKVVSVLQEMKIGSE
jgi:hypothetical protein